jgi:hypothetical protein
MVVEDQMERRFAGKLGVEPLEKLQDLLMPVTATTVATN